MIRYGCGMPSTGQEYRVLESSREGTYTGLFAGRDYLATGWDSNPLENIGSRLLATSSTRPRIADSTHSLGQRQRDRVPGLLAGREVRWPPGGQDNLVRIWDVGNRVRAGPA